MSTQDYLTAFDRWLSQHICAATKAGKDFAFFDRRLNCSFKLDDDGAAWDYVLLEPGEDPPPGRAWSVYRLQGVARRPAQELTVSIERRRQGDLIGRLMQAVFGSPKPQGRAHGRGQARGDAGRKPQLRLVG